MGTYTGTSGDDQIRPGYVSPDNIEKNPAGSSPSEAEDTLYGQSGNDGLHGGGGNDVLYGGTGNDTLGGAFETGDDRLYGEDGNDQLYGAGGNDTLNGGTGDDHLEGITGDDVLNGDEGADALEGGDGNDMLNGGGGQDRLYGGTGNDIFDFNTIGDSAAGTTRDVIGYVLDKFEVGVDKIDVSNIDANADLPGDQAFEFAATPTGPGQITLRDDDNGQTIIQLNTGNDLNPESEIAIDDGSTLASAYTDANFIL